VVRDWVSIALVSYFNKAKHRKPSATKAHTTIGTMTLSSLLVAILLGILGAFVVADCECGYSMTINGTTTVFSDLLETDFLHLASIAANTDWTQQQYNVTSKISRGTYGTSFQTRNDISNPVANNASYAAPGVLSGDPGLQLYVRGGVPSDGFVPTSQVNSVREDMLWGTYRASMKLTDVPGTCGAFFWVKTQFLS
jgi:hypothetical protein